MISKVAINENVNLCTNVLAFARSSKKVFTKIMMSRSLFQAPSSSFDPHFWEELYNLKLNVLKLDSAEQAISAYSGSCSDGKHHQSIEFTSSSHKAGFKSGLYNGLLHNVNTVEVNAC